MQKSKMAVWGGLTNSCEKKRSEKERYKHLNAGFQRRARRDKKDFLNDQYKDVNSLGDFSAFIFSLTLFCTVGIIYNEAALFIYYERINAADDIFHHC